MEAIIRYIRILEQLNKEQLKLLILLQKELNFQTFICNCLFIALVVLLVYSLIFAFFDELFDFFERFKN